MLSIDEKSQVQALDRTAPILPLRPGIPEKADPRLHPARHHHACSPRWRSPPGRSPTPATPGTPTPSSSTFLKQVAKAYPRVKLHIVCDNYGTHKHPKVATPGWRRTPGSRMHFTPTSGSWLNMVEIFFGIITRQAIRRGSFTSVKDLIAAIETFIDGWNERCQPFVWTKTADEILTKAHRKQTSNTRH